MLSMAACSGHAAQTPTVTSVDFTPDAELRVTDSGPLSFQLNATETSIPGGTFTKAGSVLLVTNDGRDDHRIVGTLDDEQVFDTGTMQPGNTTTIVIGSDGELVVRDLPTGRDAHLTVTPRPEP